MNSTDQPERDSHAGQDWSEGEVTRAVADYLEMLRKELSGEPYSKAEHRRALLPALAAGRKEGSVEFKHCNASAVLVAMGLPYVEGYKPRGNYLRLLADAVRGFLDARPGFLERLADGPVARPAKPTDFDRIDRSSVVEDPPERIDLPGDASKPWLSRRAARIDFAERDARNRELGRLGEEFAVWFERQHLLAAGRGDLAARVEWASRDVGDGLGFDVLSFDEADDSER